MKIKMYWCMNVFIIFCVEIASLDIHVSKRNGKDDTFCGTYLSPCSTFEFAVKQSRTSTATVRLDGGTDKTYVYYVNTSVILEDNITMTNYKDNEFRPVIQMINQNKNRNYLFYLSEKEEIQLKLANIIFVGTSLLQYSSSFNIIISHCSFENATTPIIQANGTAEVVTMHVSHSSIKNARFVKTLKVKNLLTVINSCTFQANSYEKRAIMELHATKVARIQVRSSTFECAFIGIWVKCTIPGRNQSTTTPNFFIEVNKSIFNGHQVAMHGIWSSNGPRIQLVESKFSGFQYSSLRVHLVKEFTISDSLFENNAAIQGGAIYIENSDITKCPGITIARSKVCEFKFSPFRVYSPTNLTVYNSTFKNNTAIQGGAIYIKSSDLFVHHSLFSYNTADSGGAIYISKGRNTSLIESSTFLYNSATISGGSFYARIPRRYHNMILHLHSVQFIGAATSPLANGIIMLTNAHVNYTNVSMAITNAIPDVPVLDGVRCDYRQRCGINQLNNLSLSCPYNFDVLPLKRSFQIFSFQCGICAKGMYSLIRANVKLSMPKRKLIVKKSDFKCLPCPPGGKCVYEIQSKGNFWGYVGSDHKVVFIPCPASYCCPPKKCVSYNTCNKNRTGILCGTCQKGYRLNYFNNNCVKNENCNQLLFWLLYLTFAILFVVLLMYYKTIFKYLYTNLEKLKRKRKKSVNNDLYRYRRFEEGIEEYKEERESSPDNDDKTEKNGGKTDLYISGLKPITFFYYQIQLLTKIPIPEKFDHGYVTVLKNSITHFFNFELVQFNMSKLCPTKDLDALSQSLIKLGNIFILFIILFLLAAIIKTFQLIRRKRNSTSTGTTTYKIMKNIRACSIQVTLLGYTAVNTFCFRMLNCVSINNENYLYIQGDIKCYTWWQYCIMIYTVLWIIPFTVSVHVSVKMLRRSQINLKQFYLSFAIPPISLYYYLRSVCTNRTLNVMNNKDDIDKVIEIFIGHYKFNENGQLNWEAVLIGRRMVLAALCAFTVNPILRVIFALLLLQGCLLHHLYVLPYRTQILNHVETASLCCLIFINTERFFFAFLYMNDESSVPGINTMATVFMWIEHVVLVAPLLIIIVLFVFARCRKLGCMLKNCFVERDE
ncbi:uncharacterized protein LOC130631506 [Hydractinia symbiolongicarpus]|uniref:uncharacterized protein LOC130631506 n=1 Tax=Hydractinia symbiolongicarpus TaxID=13093 RepID=UPI0025518C26|nr:uncharacterized protein LOC130631506 [Hydractinia symbiolongicarpus]